MQQGNRSKRVGDTKEKEEIFLLKKQIQKLTAQLNDRDSQLAEIYMSKEWKLIKLFHKLVPPNGWLSRMGARLFSTVAEFIQWANLFLLQKRYRAANIRDRRNHARVTGQDNRELQQKYIKGKSKIGYIIPGTAISGGVAVVCEHVNRLLLRGHNVSIIAQNNSDRIPWFPNQLAPVYPLGQIKGDAYDIIVATSWGTAYAANLLNADRKIYFVQSDESRFYKPNGLKSKWANKTYRMDFEFITMAKWLRDWIKSEFGHDAIYVPNGINEQIIFQDTALAPKGEKIRVLLEGPIDIPFKGMKEAFLAVEGLDCEVWCVSTLGRPKPEWKCDKFFEKVPFGKIRHIYSSCDILLKMSRVESFAYPPLEMMACGGTAVVGKVTGIDEYIVDGYNALVVGQGDIEGAHLALKTLIEDERLRNELINNGKKTAEKFRWDASIDILERLFINDSAK